MEPSVAVASQYVNSAGKDRVFSHILRWCEGTLDSHDHDIDNTHVDKQEVDIDFDRTEVSNSKHQNNTTISINNDSSRINVEFSNLKNKECSRFSWSMSPILKQLQSIESFNRMSDDEQVCSIYSENAVYLTSWWLFKRQSRHC